MAAFVQASSEVRGDRSFPCTAFRIKDRDYLSHGFILSIVEKCTFAQKHKCTRNLETTATDNPKCIVDRESGLWAGDQTDVEFRA